MDGDLWLSVMDEMDVKFILIFFQHFGYNISNFPSINQWYQRMSKYEGIKECDEGAQEFGEMIKGKLGNSFTD